MPKSSELDQALESIQTAIRRVASIDPELAEKAAIYEAFAALKRSQSRLEKMRSTRQSLGYARAVAV
jgi:hypothetical protein